MAETVKICARCVKKIPLVAVSRKYCGAQFEVTSTGYCQNCHEDRDAAENSQCKVCGKQVVDLRVESRFTGGLIQKPICASQPSELTENKRNQKSRQPIGILVRKLFFAVIETVWFDVHALVQVDHIVDVDDKNVTKYDIKFSTPVHNTTVTTTTPTLNWEYYPDAAYYEVYVLNPQADEPLTRDEIETVSASQYIFSKSLATGIYSWSIKAYNADGIDFSGRGSKISGSSNFNGKAFRGEEWWNSFIVAP